jgi:DNA repair protein RadC
MKVLRAGKMAQQVRALTALSKVLSSNPSNHMVAHNYPSRDLMPSSGA